jgi:hypothetical protein
VGKKATVETSRCTSVPTFVEKHRDITSYSKRKGDLPSQKEEDPIDMRAVLHRDGSVISAVTLDELNRPDRLYYNLGCKTAVRLEGRSGGSREGGKGDRGAGGQSPTIAGSLSSFLPRIPSLPLVIM